VPDENHVPKLLELEQVEDVADVRIEIDARIEQVGALAEPRERRRE
jgi:hypothetical protein